MPSYKEDYDLQMKRIDALSTLYPNFQRITEADENDFLGASILRADPDGFLLVWRRQGLDGGPEVGFQWFQHLFGLVDAIEVLADKNRFRPDDKAKYQKTEPGTKQQ
jgi:hypothetical protein